MAETKSKFYYYELSDFSREGESVKLIEFINANDLVTKAHKLLRDDGKKIYFLLCKRNPEEDNYYYGKIIRPRDPDNYSAYSEGGIELVSLGDKFKNFIDSLFDGVATSRQKSVLDNELDVVKYAFTLYENKIYLLMQKRARSPGVGVFEDALLENILVGATIEHKHMIKPGLRRKLEVSLSKDVKLLKLKAKKDISGILPSDTPFENMQGETNISDKYNMTVEFRLKSRKKGGPSLTLSEILTGALGLNQESDILETLLREDLSDYFSFINFEVFEEDPNDKEAINIFDYLESEELDISDLNEEEAGKMLCNCLKNKLEMSSDEDYE